MPLIVALLLHVDGLYQDFVIAPMYPVLAILFVFFISIYNLKAQKGTSPAHSHETAASISPSIRSNVEHGTLSTCTDKIASDRKKAARWALPQRLHRHGAARKQHANRKCKTQARLHRLHPVLFRTCSSEITRHDLSVSQRVLRAYSTQFSPPTYILAILTQARLSNLFTFTFTDTAR
jgi:hypothetical protein